MRYALYETKGDVTLIREPELAGEDAQLVRMALRDAAGVDGPDQP